MPSTRQDFAYPLRISSNGGLELASDDELIQDRIRALIETRPLEMIMRSGYGLSDQAFTALPSPEVIAERVRQVLEIQLGNEIVPFIGSRLDAENGVLELEINWQRVSGNGDTVSDARGREGLSYRINV